MEQILSCLKMTKDGLSELIVQVKPGASKNQIEGVIELVLPGRKAPQKVLKIKIKAPPVDGKANEAVIGFIAEMLKIASSKILLAHGEKGRVKTLKIQL